MGRETTFPVRARACAASWCCWWAALCSATTTDRRAPSATRPATTSRRRARTAPRSAPATRRPEPTTTTIEVLPGAPLLRESSGLQVVVGGRRLIDLDTGESRPLACRGSCSGAVTERRLVVTAMIERSSCGRLPTTARVDEARDDPGRPVVHKAWWSAMAPSSGCSKGSLRWVRRASPTPPTWSTWRPDPGPPRHPLTSGVRSCRPCLVVSGTGGIYVIDFEGAVDRMSTGDLVAVAHNRVDAYTCDERLQCGIEVLDEWGQRLDWSPNTGVHPARE